MIYHLYHLYHILSYARRFHNPRMYAPLPVMTKTLKKMKTSRNYLKFPKFGHMQWWPIHSCAQGHFIHFGGGL